MISEKSARKCNFCNAPLKHQVVDLGMQPLCQDRIKPVELNKMEPHFPLKVYICDECFLVQVPESASPELIYRDYGYYSSFSDTWVNHAKKYVNYAVEEFGVTPDKLVAEIASNDGYLLQFFVEKGIPVLGIEPSKRVAEYAIKEKNVRTEIKFFGTKTAADLIHSYGKADLIIGNNVLAHVPNINDFVKGMKLFLKHNGVITMEFPHILKLVEGNQFDTIYHEHFSYLSFSVVKNIFQRYELVLYHVEELPTHGGSIRIHARHQNDYKKPIRQSVTNLLAREEQAGLNNLEYYTSFKEKVQETKRKILNFLIQAKREGKQIIGYGAPGKGNTLLNYCGIRTDFLDYTVDRSPHKQGNYLPGTHIPIYSPEMIKETKPDYIFILPWNLKEEIISHHKYVYEWGARFVVPIPELKIIDQNYAKQKQLLNAANMV